MVERIELSAATPAEAAAARRTLGSHLQRWRCAEADDVMLVFSELVTNAVRHAGGAPRIDVSYGEQTLRIDVHDRSHDVPRPRAHTISSGGFGLGIVAQISDRWGWDQTAHGKTVWSVVPC